MMIQHNLFTTIALASAGILLGPVVCQADLVGSDSASAAAYAADDNNVGNDGNPANNTNGWVTGDNGFTAGPGTFGAWTLTTSGGTAGFFIGDSRNLSSGQTGANINSSGVSFGMFGASGSQANAFRSFATALSPGQIFSIDLGVNFRNGFKGMDLRDTSGNAIFNFDVSNPGTGDDYRVQFASGGSGSIGNTYSSNTAFHLSFFQTTTSGGNWTIARSGGISDLDTGTYTGTPASIKLYVGNTGGGSPNDLYANNLSISAVPEANQIVAVALVGAVCCGIAFLRKARLRCAAVSRFPRAAESQLGPVARQTKFDAAGVGAGLQRP